MDFSFPTREVSSWWWDGKKKKRSITWSGESDSRSYQSARSPELPGGESGSRPQAADGDHRVAGITLWRASMAWLHELMFMASLLSDRKHSKKRRKKFTRNGKWSGSVIFDIT